MAWWSRLSSGDRSALAVFRAAVGWGVVHVPRPGAIGVFVDVGLQVGGFVGVLMLPLDAEYWPTVGTQSQFKVWWADERMQIRLKPVDLAFLREDFEAVHARLRPNWRARSQRVDAGFRVGDGEPRSAVATTASRSRRPGRLAHTIENPAVPPTDPGHDVAESCPTQLVTPTSKAPDWLRQPPCT
jgi:hypothetical protein